MPETVRPDGAVGITPRLPSRSLSGVVDRGTVSIPRTRPSIVSGGAGGRVGRSRVFTRPRKGGTSFPKETASIDGVERSPGSAGDTPVAHRPSRPVKSASHQPSPASPETETPFSDTDNSKEYSYAIRTKTGTGYR